MLHWQQFGQHAFVDVRDDLVEALTMARLLEFCHVLNLMLACVNVQHAIAVQMDQRHLLLACIND